MVEKNYLPKCFAERLASFSDGFGYRGGLGFGLVNFVLFGFTRKISVEMWSLLPATALELQKIYIKHIYK